MNYSITKYLNLENFIDFGVDDFLVNGLLDFIKNKKYSCDEYGHPNSDGYNYIVNKIIEKYEQNN